MATKKFGLMKRPVEDEEESVPVDPKFKLPKTVAACGDLLYQLREERLAMERQVKAVAAKEAVLRDHIISRLPKQDATGVRGKVAQTTIKTVTKPSPRDWAKIQKYIKKNAAFDLLQRRLNEAAVSARWEEGEEIPGVDRFDVVTVSCTKIGAK